MSPHVAVGRALTSALLTAVRRTRAPSDALPFAAVVAAVATLVAAFVASAQATLFIAAAAQTLGVAWLGVRALAQPRTWASATFVAAASFAVLFVVPSWIFAVDPAMLDVGSPTEALLLVNVSLYALLLGWHLPVRRAVRQAARRSLLGIRPVPVSVRRVIVSFGISVASLMILFAANGGPLRYFENLDRSGEFMAGLTYVFWGLLAAKFTVFSYVAAKWARGQDLDRRTWGMLGAVFLLLALHGSRGPLVIALVELCLIRTLVWKRIRVGTVVVASLTVLLLVVFGLGAIKRYQKLDYEGTSARVGYVDYLVNVAPGDSVTAYATNYADQVRLLALARAVVPSDAGYEYGRIVARLALQPIPRFFRPEITRDPDLARALYPTSLYAYAVPLQADAYIQFGVGGMVIVFVLVGAVLRQIDLRLNAAQRLPLRTFLALMALAIALALVLRSGLQGGVAFGAIEIIGFWLAATVIDSRWSPQAAGRRLWHRKRLLLRRRNAEA